MAAEAQGLGRYVLYDEFARGGMAAVHLGRLRSEQGFSRTVAIKRLHPHLAKDEEFTRLFLDEARIAARLRHPNIVSTLDVVVSDGEIFLVMEYIHGESLAQLARRLSPKGLPSRIAAAVIHDTLLGLHAAHEARSENGEPLCIVHRDVSPQNVLVGADGLARLLDFGVARAVGQLHTTRDGELRGKLSYMAPEQLRSGRIDRRTDVFATGVLLWELLTGQRLFAGEDEGATVTNVLTLAIAAPSSVNAEVPPAFDAVVLRALARDPAKRFGTARQMAVALEACGAMASATEVGEWHELVAGPGLVQRASRIVEIESGQVAPAGPLLGASSELDRTEAVVSLASPHLKASGRRTAWIAAGLGITFSVIAVDVALRMRRGPANSSTSSAPEVTAIARLESPPPSTLDAPPGASSAAEAQPRPAPRESPEGSVGRPAADPPAPKSVASVTRAPRVKPRPTHASKPDCEPPYTVNAQGLEIPKPQCL